jgi:hypothetical protein
MSFDLKDYVDVKTRIAEFKKEYPDGRLTSDIVESGFEGFITVKAYAYRTPDDPTPGTGLAWEPVPGPTTYTKDSELQNAETSAWGRAIVAALIADASAGVASADEVRNRAGGSNDEGRSPSPAQACPHCGSMVYDNRAENYGTKKPLWKCSNKTCGGGKNGYSWASWDDDPFSSESPVREEFDEVAYAPGEEPFV